MKTMLFLAHRIPFPPDKGDKIRSYHLLRHFSQQYRVLLGFFVDDAADWQHVERLKAWLPEIHAVALSRSQLRWRAGVSLFTSESFSIACYRDRRIYRWLDELTTRESIDIAFAFSSSMGGYLRHPGLQYARKVIDFVDLDSEKWRQYAEETRWPMSWIYAREGMRLLKHEGELAQSVDHNLFITPEEQQLFVERSGHSEPLSLSALGNGVDLAHFSRQQDYPSPYDEGYQPIVFTGAMDYQPNIQAVSWFTKQVMPRLRRNAGNTVFYIVGRAPTKQVQQLANDRDVIVTGGVPDMRPFLAHARVAVAPLQIARGIQNKVLEAMAMSTPVVASPQALCGIDRDNALALLAASSAEQYEQKILQLLDNEEQQRQLGQLGRRWVDENFAWPSNLSRMNEVLRG